MNGAFTQVVVAVGLALCAARATAQVALPSVGDRVRIVMHNGERVSGRVAYAHQDTLRIRTGMSGEFVLTRAFIESYSSVIGHNRGKSALIGGAVGAGIGAVLIGVGLVADRRSGDPIIKPEAITVPAALITTALGAGIGFLVAPAQWSPQLRLSRETRLDSPHLRVGLGLSYSFQF